MRMYCDDCGYEMQAITSGYVCTHCHQTKGIISTPKACEQCGGTPCFCQFNAKTTSNGISVSMTDKASERDELIKWQDNIDIESKEADETLDGETLWREKYGDRDKQDVIADFIIAREQSLKQEHERALEEIEKPLIFAKNGFYRNDKAIDEALSTINRLRGKV